jgi:two-component SAPR family response regulator
LVEITRNSTFLKNINNEWLDPFKADVSNETVDTLLKWATANSEKSDPASIIPLADAILDFDPIDEAAIELKCKSLVRMGKHSLAKSTLDTFTKEYKVLYGEDFKETFKTLIE